MWNLGPRWGNVLNQIPDHVFNYTSDVCYTKQGPGAIRVSNEQGQLSWGRPFGLSSDWPSEGSGEQRDFGEQDKLKTSQ